MGLVDETEQEGVCPHCKKKITLYAQTKGDSISWIGIKDNG